MPAKKGALAKPNAGKASKVEVAPVRATRSTRSAKQVEEISEVEDAEETEEDIVDDDEEQDGNNDDDDDQEEDEDDEEEDDDEEDEEDDDDDDEEVEDSADDGFEVQSSSDEEDEGVEDESDYDGAETSDAGSESDASAVDAAEAQAREWKAKTVGVERSKLNTQARSSVEGLFQNLLNTDDLSSDDEEGGNLNTIGRVPLHWYDAFEHIGYNTAGKKIVKRSGKDKLDLAIANKDDPASRRTIYDMYNDREVVLTEREMEIIRRVQAGAFAHPEHDAEPESVDYFTSIIEPMPISAMPEPKRRFTPSKWEMMRVMKIVKAIKEGRYKEGEKDKKDGDDSKAPVYLIWNDQEDEVLAESKRHQFHLPAPKMPLPGHAESYNPPPEYLLTEEEAAAQADLDPKERQYNFTPSQYACMRHVPGYDNFVTERFERCLDLYLCPRKLKRRLNIDPQTLVPRLPKPRELKPFPNSLCLQFVGHSAAVRSISLSPDGQYLASGSDDGTVRLWELDTGLCRYTWNLSTSMGSNGKAKVEPVVCVAWNPESYHHVLAAAVGSRVVLISTGTGDVDGTDITESQLGAVMEQAMKNGPASTNVEEEEEEEEEENNNGSDSEDGGSRKKKSSKGDFTWKLCVSGQQEGKSAEAAPKRGRDKKAAASAPSSSSVSSGSVVVGPRIEMKLDDAVTHVAWHYKGDYLVSVSPQAGAKAVSVHQISKGKTQFPFSKSPGNVSSAYFHPSQPFLFIVTQQQVKIFNLVEQKLIKKLLTNCKWVSCADIHPGGDHVVAGSYDRRVVIFDLDLSSSPYRTLKFHEKAVRHVQFHKRYPLLASASDDGAIHIFHCMVYSDLERNPLIVPLKVLKGHGVVGGAGVLCLMFHPRQPWIISAGADGIINLFQDI